jgi:hypothetical protein
MGAGYSANGIVAVTQRDDHSVAVRVLDISVSDQTSTLPERVRPGDWIGHVHNMRCEDNQSGGHWQVWWWWWWFYVYVCVDRVLQKGFANRRRR